MAEATKVTLVHGKDERDFDIEHAQALLKYEQSKGFSNWKLAEGSKFKFENGTIDTTSAGTSQKPGK